MSSPTPPTSRRARTTLCALLLACLGGADAAHADITAAQAQALAEHGARLRATFLLGVLGACATTYPDLRPVVVDAMRFMTTDLPDEEASKIISAVGRCMGSEGIPSRSQCSNLATKLPRVDFNFNDEQYKTMLMDGLTMLEPCRKGS